MAQRHSSRPRYRDRHHDHNRDHFSDSIQDAESYRDPESVYAHRSPSVNRGSIRSGSLDKGSNRARSASRQSDAPSSSIYDEHDKQFYKPKRRFIDLVQGIWPTRQMTDSTDRDREFEVMVRELITYLIFLTIVLILTFGMISTTMYWYTKVLTDLFVETSFHVEGTEIKFKESTRISHFWGFAENAMVNGLFWDFWYDIHDPVGNISSEDRKILYENKLLGLPRLRQVKVRNDSCIVHEDFRRVFKTCYDFYSKEAEDTEPFGPGTYPAWRYSTEKELEGYSYWGKLTTYQGGGYYENLPLRRNETLERVFYLKENLWVTRGTRAIFFDFTVYNANINLFCIVRMLFEIPPTGGVIPSSSFRTVKLLRYVTAFDYFVLACEYMFVVFIIFYTIEEILEIIVLRFDYLRQLWNYLDLSILVVAYILIVFSIYRYFIVEPMVYDLLQETKFANFDFIGFWQVQYNNAIGVLIFLVWIKIFKYISFNKTMAQLSMTLSRCAKDIAGFAIMFFIVFFAFAQLGYLLFGTQVADFKTFGASIFTLLRTVLGDFNYSEIEEANRILGPIFFICYIFFVFFVLLNMFLAIINDTYTEVKTEISAQRTFVMSDYIQRCWGNMLTKFGCKSKVTGKVADEDDEKLTYNEIRNVLRKCNFTDLEIEMFFAKYDIDGDKAIGREETRRMLTDLEGRRVSASDQGNGVPQEEFLILQNRVNRMEDSISRVVDKVDAILTKLDGLQQAKR